MTVPGSTREKGTVQSPASCRVYYGQAGYTFVRHLARDLRLKLNDQLLCIQGEEPG